MWIRPAKTVRTSDTAGAGCPYNAIAPSGGSLDGVDPHCVAYKKIFDEINNRFNTEMFENPVMEMNQSRSQSLKICPTWYDGAYAAQSLRNKRKKLIIAGDKFPISGFLPIPVTPK